MLNGCKRCPLAAFQGVQFRATSKAAKAAKTSCTQSLLPQTPPQPQRVRPLREKRAGRPPLGSAAVGPIPQWVQAPFGLGRCSQALNSKALSGRLRAPFILSTFGLNDSHLLIFSKPFSLSAFGSQTKPFCLIRFALCHLLT